MLKVLIRIPRSVPRLPGVHNPFFPSCRPFLFCLIHSISCHTGKGDVTHFKSVVHAREARLGCGIKIRPGDGTYVVAHYSLPPGEKFKLNDFIPSKDVQIRKQPGNELDISICYLLICSYTSRERTP